MSKVFKSAYAEHAHQELIILPVDDGVRVSADHKSHGSRGVIIATSDAPALALAILEAAGHKEVMTDRTDASYNSKWAMRHLRQLVEAQERATAEAKEREELEAEALGLMNAYGNVPARVSEPAPESFEGMPLYVRERWLAVARKARELAKEAGE